MLVMGDLQLEKAQEQQSRWQSLGRTHPDRKRLETDIEDECKSISWQVRNPCKSYSSLKCLRLLPMSRQREVMEGVANVWKSWVQSGGLWPCEELAGFALAAALGLDAPTMKEKALC